MTKAHSTIKLPIQTKQEQSFPSLTYPSRDSGLLHLDNISQPELDVYLSDPKINTKKAMIVAPGGALFFHSIENEGSAVAKMLVANGINAFVLKYRLYPVNGNAEDYVNDLVAKEDWEGVNQRARQTLPYALEDAIETIKHLRDNSTSFNIDANQIGMMGFSAGGALTLETLFHAPELYKPNYIAGIYPWIEIISKYQFSNKNTPAFFSCASDDELMIAPQVAELYKEWINSGQQAELHLHESGGHGYGMRDIPQVNKWFEMLIQWVERR